ncbi:MAG: response regulator [Proteobacteria bacterium]|nr:response regulator [Pseudomonadota bacterium]
MGDLEASSTAVFILLVEDNAINIKIASRMLVKLGFAVDTALNGQQAIEAIKIKQFALILMDLQMPEMDGLTATHWLRAHQQELIYLPPIVAMSANYSPAELEKCLQAGMVDFIPKPVSMDHLAKTLQRWTQPRPVGTAV